MKRTKFITLLFSLMLAVTSLTSCLSNSDNNQSGQGFAVAYYVGSTYGSPRFLLADSSAYIVPTTTSSLKVPTSGLTTGDLCYITYQAATSQQTKADATTPSYTVDLLSCWSIEYKKTQSMDLEAFKQDTALITPDSLKQQATIISLQSFMKNNEPYTVVNAASRTGEYKLLSAINYYVAVNPSSSTYMTDVLNSNLFYFYYDKNDWKDSKTLVLRLARFSKFTKAPQGNLQPYASFSVGGPVAYFSYDVTDAVNAFKTDKGALPTSVKVTNVYIGNNNLYEWAVTDNMSGTEQNTVDIKLQ